MHYTSFSFDSNDHGLQKTPDMIVSMHSKIKKKKNRSIHKIRKLTQIFNLIEKLSRIFFLNKKFVSSAFRHIFAEKVFLKCVCMEGYYTRLLRNWVLKSLMWKLSENNPLVRPNISKHLNAESKVFVRCSRAQVYICQHFLNTTRGIFANGHF